ncbi:MAG TPA: dihydroorotase family protein [Cellulomonas sp.]
MTSQPVPPTDRPVDLVVTGLVRLPPGRWAPGEVWCDAGVVVAVVEGGTEQPARRRLSYPGSYLVPGAVDAHVHAYSASTEGLLAATSAAAAGGVTTVIEMPYDEAAPINDAARVIAKTGIVEREAVVDVGLLGTLAPGGGWREAAAMVDAGVVGFKLSLYHTHPVRFPRIGHLDMLASMAEIRDAGSTLCVHAEDDEIVRDLAADPSRASSDGWQAHGASRPPIAETLGTLTALELAAEQGVRVHICHASLPRVVDLVTWYRGQGVDASVETCPHYLAFSEDDMAEQGARLKINPPMRPVEAVEGLWQRLGAGDVAVVSSDHAPWVVAQKTRTPFLANASGAPGIETLLPATLGLALRRDPSGRLFDAALDALTIGPARRYGLDARKGSLEPGKDADLVVLTPDPDAVLDEATLHSNAGWSPFHGRALGARVALTVNRGTVVWDAATGEVGPAGGGLLVTRPPVPRPR